MKHLGKIQRMFTQGLSLCTWNYYPKISDDIDQYHVCMYVCVCMYVFMYVFFFLKTFISASQYIMFFQPSCI